MSGIEPAVARVMVIVPAALLVLLTGILVLLALPCDKERRAYALAVSAQAMQALSALMNAPPSLREKKGPKTSVSRRSEGIPP